MLGNDFHNDFSWRISSAWAKCALHSFRISLVLRSSHTSRSSSLIHYYSAVQPNLPTIDSGAAHCQLPKVLVLRGEDLAHCTLDDLGGKLQ